MSTPTLSLSHDPRRQTITQFQMQINNVLKEILFLSPLATTQSVSFFFTKTESLEVAVSIHAPSLSHDLAGEP